MTDENGNDYRQIAYQYFVDRGYAPTVAAGLVGNLETESSSDLDPNASDGNGAYGIGQWQDSRLTDLQNFASNGGYDVSNIYTQLAFMDYELHHNESGALQSILDSDVSTPESAAYAVSNYYERPAWKENPERQTNARNIFDSYYGGDGSDVSQGTVTANYGTDTSGSADNDADLLSNLPDDMKGINPAMNSRVAMVFKKARELGVEPILTAGANDDSHAENSWHYNGLAADIAWNGLDWDSPVLHELADYARSIGFQEVIDDPHGTGPHLHIGNPNFSKEVQDILGHAQEPHTFGEGLPAYLGDKVSPELYEMSKNAPQWEPEAPLPSLFESLAAGFHQSSNWFTEGINAINNDLFYSDHDAFGQQRITDADKDYVKAAMGDGNEAAAQHLIDIAHDPTELYKLLKDKMDDIQQQQQYAQYASRSKAVAATYMLGNIGGSFLDPTVLVPMLKAATVAKTLARLGGAITDVNKIDRIATAGAAAKSLDFAPSVGDMAATLAADSTGAITDMSALSNTASAKAIMDSATKLASTAKKLDMPVTMANMAGWGAAQDYLNSKSANEESNMVQAALMGGVAGGVLKVLGVGAGKAWKLLADRHLDNLADTATRVENGSILHAADMPNAYTVSPTLEKAKGFHDADYLANTDVANKDNVFALSLKDAQSVGRDLGINVDNDTKSFFVPYENYVAVVKDNIKDGDSLSGILQHEIGVHQNLKATIGEDNYKALMQQVTDASHDTKSPFAQAAAKLDTSDPEEILGYAVEHNLLGGKTNKPTVFGDAARKPITFYHGTNTDFGVFDTNKSGGFINFTTDKNVAKKYAMGSGGNRARLSDDDMFITDSDGNAYVKDKKGDWVAVGSVSDEGDFSTLQKGKTRYVKVGEKIPKKDVDNIGNMNSDYTVFPKKYYIKEAYLDLKKPLDLINNMPEGLKVLQDIQKKLFAEGKGNRTLQAAIDSLRDNNGSMFWRTTKYAAFNDDYKNVIIPELKKQGYDGIIFHDDSHTTYAIFDNKQVLDKIRYNQQAPSIAEFLIDSFKNGLSNLGVGGKTKFSNKQILDMVDKAMHYTPYYTVNPDGSVVMNGVKFSKNNLCNPNSIIDYMQQLKDAREIYGSSSGVMDKVANFVGKHTEGDALTRTPYGLFAHAYSPTMVKLASSLFEDAQQRGIQRLSGLPTTERMKDTILNILNQHMIDMGDARQAWITDHYGVLASHTPLGGRAYRQEFNKLVNDGYNHMYAGTTLGIDENLLKDPNVQKGIAALKALTDQRIELGKKSGSMFGRPDANLIEPDWYGVHEETHRIVDPEMYSDLLTHFQNGGDEAARKWLTNYAHAATDRNKVAQMIERDKKLHGVPDENGKVDTSVSPEEVTDYIDTGVKNWVKHVLGSPVNEVFDKDVTGKNALGDLNFFRGRLPMDTGMQSVLPDGTPFSFDNNLRWYDLDSIYKRTNRRFAGDIAMKNTMDGMGVKNYNDLITQVHTELQRAKDNKLINKSQLGRMTKWFDDNMNDLRGMSTKREDLTGADVAARNLNNLAFFKQGGNMGWSQVGDLGAAIAYNGGKEIFSLCRPLAKFVDDCAHGKANDDMLEDFLWQLCGDEAERHVFSTGWDDAIVRSAMAKDTIGSRMMLNASDMTHNLGKITSTVNMLPKMTASMIHQARKDSILDAIRWAHGKEFNSFRNPFTDAKLGALGRDVDIDKLKADIRRYVPWDGKKGTTATKADFSTWQMDNPETYWQFHDLVQNQANRCIQEGTSIGNRNMMSQANAVSRMLYFFKSFNMRANNSQTARALHSRDVDDAIAFALSMISNVGAFAARNGVKIAALTALGQTDEAQRIRDNYMNNAALAYAAFERSGFMSPLSTPNDLWEATTGAPTVRTTVTDKPRQPVSLDNPAGAVGNFMSQTPSIETGWDTVVTPTYAAWNLAHSRASQRDLENLMNLVPIPNFIPYTQAVQTLAGMSGLPEKRPKQQKQ